MFLYFVAGGHSRMPPSHVRSRLVWEKLQHLKLIRRQISESGGMKLVYYTLGQILTPLCHSYGFPIHRGPLNITTE